MTNGHDNFLSLSVSSRLKEQISTAARWAKILAIVNFVSIPLGFIDSVKDNNAFSALIGAAITLVINIFLFNFSRKVKSAMDVTDQFRFNEGLNDLRMYFKVTGIVVIVVLAILVIALLFALAFDSNFFE